MTDLTDGSGTGDSEHDSETTGLNRTFGWWDMWADPEHDPREAGGPYSGERDTLVRYLRDRRLTLQMKCAGLDAEGMARRSVPPSDLSLLGLVRHMARVEQFWFREFMAGETVQKLFKSESGEDEAFSGVVADDEAVGLAWDAWHAEVAFAERFVADAPDLDVMGKPRRPDRSPRELRDVIVHMIEEYARHNGHADLIRERIDGRIGQ